MHAPRTRAALAAALLGLLLPTSALAGDGRLQVVASFSILADLVREIGGDRVAVHSLVGADADAHVFRPSPQDARRIANADIVFVNGLGFEGWIDRLVVASGYTGPIAVAARGIPTIDAAGHGYHHGPGEAESSHDEAHHAEHDEHADDDHDDGDKHPHHADTHGAGDADPHVWHSLARSRFYVTNIAAALIRLDPAGARVYAARLERLLGEIAELEHWVQDSFAKLPRQQRILITSHDAFGYLADDFDLEVFAPVGLSTAAEASPADLAAIIHQIRERNVKAVFLDNVTNPRLLQQLGRETGVGIGGRLYSDALSGPEGPASGYLEMMGHNLVTILKGLWGEI